MSTQYLKAYRILKKIKWFGMLLSGLVVFVMMLYTCLDVFLRNVFNSTSLHTYEFSQYYFMPLAVFPALAFAYGKGIMPRIDFIIEKVNIRFQRIMAIFLILVEIILFLLLSIYGAKYALSTIQDSTAFSAVRETTYLGQSLFLLH